VRRDRCRHRLSAETRPPGHSPASRHRHNSMGTNSIRSSSVASASTPLNLHGRHRRPLAFTPARMIVVRRESLKPISPYASTTGAPFSLRTLLRPPGSPPGPELPITSVRDQSGWVQSANTSRTGRPPCRPRPTIRSGARSAEHGSRFPTTPQARNRH
jgi:hypothetical protein